MGYLIWTRRQTLAGLMGAASATAACSEQTTTAETSVAEARFLHGVASGDPSSDGCVIWTRATPEESAGNDTPVIAWDVARDQGFSDIVKSGAFKTDASIDFTVKVTVDGLEPGQTYFYRFRSGDTLSPAGRLRTLPVGAVDQLRIAAASCSNFPAGYFHAYRHLAEQGDLDVVLHLGDYLYEYGPDGYAGETGKRIGRVPEPQKEILTLEDYRTRYAQYRSDPDLQAAHAAAPWIPIWDDHESANDSWKDGAQNHDEGEGDWATRKAVAVRAWYEWMPVREPGEGRSKPEIWRAFAFGDLAQLVALETRLTGRSEQLSYAEDLPLIETPFDFTDPQDPKPILDPATLAGIDPANVRTLPTPFDMTSGTPVPILDYKRIIELDPANMPDNITFLPNTKKFVDELLADEARMMMPPVQESFVSQELAQADTRGAPWSVIANQVIMAPVTAPDLDESLSAETKAAAIEALPVLARYFALSKLGIPWNLDAWDGYSAQRDRLLEAFAASASDVVVLTGDTHSFWANDLNAPGGARAGVEFGVTSISSPSVIDFFGITERGFGDLFVAANDHVRYNNVDDRGYILLTLTADEARAEMIAVTDVTSKPFEARVASTWIVPRGEPMREG